MYLTRRLALLGAALAAAFPAVHAAGAEAVDQIATLADIVVVSGSKEGTLLRDTPAAISKIGRETIEQKKPTFVGQLLNEVPGVYVTDLGNEQHSMSIRQPLSYNAVYLYMEDGLPIRPVGLFNHNSLYEINLTGVGDIEVLKGPASSLYGSNAVGGAVNFFTRAPSPKPEATIGVQLTDQGYRRIDYGASGAFGNHGLRIAGYKAQRRGGWQSYNDADKDGVTLRYDLGVSDTTLLKTVLSYNRLLTDMPGTLNKSDYDNRPGFSYQTFTWRKVEATRLSSALEGNWNSGGMTTITAYARDNTTNQLPSYLIFNTGAFTALGRTTSQHFTSLGVDARHRQDFSDGTFRLIAGITGENTPMEASEMNLSVVRDPASGIYTAYAPSTLRRDYEVDVSSRAAYAQIEYALVKEVRVVAGGRHDRIRYDYTNRLAPSASTGAPTEFRSYSRFSPKVGATWNFASGLNWYGNVSRGFTPPEVSAQYGGSLIAPNLRASTFDNLDTGLRWRANDKTLTADVGIYRLTGKDEVISYSIAPGRSESRNAGRTRHEGIEFGFTYQPEKMWDARLNGAVARHVYRDYETSSTLNFSGNEIPGSPRWLVNGEIGFKPLQSLRLSAEMQHVGAYYMDDANQVRYPGHMLLNLRANYAVGAGEVWASLMNAAGRKYAEIAASSFKGVGTHDADAQDAYTPGVPRTFLIGVRYRFGEK